MSVYITPDGRKRVDPGPLFHGEKRRLKRLGVRKAKPRGAAAVTAETTGGQPCLRG